MSGVMRRVTGGPARRRTSSRHRRVALAAGIRGDRMSVGSPSLASEIRVPSAGAARARHRVVIVGCGFGGLFAAQALRQADVDVTVIDRSNRAEERSGG